MTLAQFGKFCIFNVTTGWNTCYLEPDLAYNILTFSTQD
jgi:hypothetical protein